MQPDRLTVTLRPRSAMEAIDLGFAMTQTHARAIWQAWLRFVLPVMLLLALAGQYLAGKFGVSGLLIWWAKPYYDVVVLLVLSRAVFGEQLSARQLTTELRRSAGTIAAALTLRRLSLSRSFLLPVHVLEGIHGPRKRDRITLLRADTTGSARLATMACGWGELAIAAGLASLVVWFTPEIFRPALYDVFSAEESGPAAMAAWQVVYLLTVSLLEPFYVAAGFALYLNRRTQLEGWDIEVALRRIHARTAAPATMKIS
jgi:hypothetical protein